MERALWRSRATESISPLPPQKVIIVNKRFQYILSATLLMSALWGACGDDGGQTGDSVGPLSSDGTPGGDLVDLQMQQSAELCDCLSGDLRALCWDSAWPKGRPECFRDAYNTRAAQNQAALSCAKQTVKKSVDCLAAAGCDSDAQGACNIQFSKDEEACPKLDAEATAAGDACVGEDLDVYCDDGEPSVISEWCNGKQDCADNSDESYCDITSGG